MFHRCWWGQLESLLEPVVGEFFVFDCVVVGGFLQLAFQTLDLLLVLLAYSLQLILVELGLFDLSVKPLLQVAELVVLGPQLRVQTLILHLQLHDSLS